MKIYNSVPLIVFIMCLFGCSSNKNLETVDHVDLNKYRGKWYEIARLPNSFEKGLVCVTANYSIKDNGKIEVLNRGHKESDKSKIKQSKGTAWVPDTDEPGRLKVSFFWPFAGDYYIMALDDGYDHALVGSPSRKYLWILARHKKLPDNITSELLALAASSGFDVDKLEWIDQTCD